MEKTVDPSPLGVSEKVRTPLNMGAMPSLQIMLRPGSTFETRGVKTRVGALGTFSRRRWLRRRSLLRLEPGAYQ